MKRVSMIMVCLLAMLVASTGVKAQEVTITLIPGWTWISCPMTEAIDFATALGDFTPMTGDAIKSQWGNAYYRNGRWAGSISEFHPGYGYKYYSNRTTPVSVTFNAQQSSSQVVVTTTEPMLITAVSAMGGGEVTTDDGVFILAKGICWATHEDPTTNEDASIDAGSGVGSFSASMDGLNIATTYYVRAYAVTADGTTYGDQKTFTTRDGIPEVSTASVTNILGNGATCGGTVTDNGGLNVTARGVCWSTVHNPTISDSHTTNSSGLGNFTSSITGLSVSTTYYVRAYASTSQGTAYGEEVNFTTRDGIPTVTTSDITNILGDGATGGGNVTDDGGLDVVSRGVCWSTSPNPTLADLYTASGNGIGTFTCSIIGLNVSTTYYVRAYVTNSFVTVYGNEKTFTTLDGVPSVTTAEVTNIGIFGANCGGNVTNDGGLTVTRGVCWNTVPNPTINDSHTSDGLGLGSFSSHMSGLNHSTTYYVRAYATTDYITTYGEEVSFTTLNLPEGAIDGQFSVSASEQVCFSQGNLQYIGSASTPYWKFADNQWDVLGTTTGQNSSNQSVDRDLFGWGTSGWNNGNTYYQPWSTADYHESNSGQLYGPPGNYDLSGNYANADWGVYNPISNGGNQANQWRTLTNNEWVYVVNTRATASGIRYAKAKVNNVNGVILLPDDWSTSYYTLSNTNSSSANFSSNIITASQWDTLEQHGAVFLPTAGSRIGTSIYSVGSNGYYWSASSFNSNNVHLISFNDGNLYTQIYSSRYYGTTVRPVCSSLQN